MAWSYMERTLGGGAAAGMLRPGAKYCHILSSDWGANALEADPLVPLSGPLLKWRSRLVSLFRPGAPRVFSSAVQPDGQRLGRLASYVDAGQIRPVVDRVFEGLDSVVEAFEYLETGHAKGKVIVRVSDAE